MVYNTQVQWLRLALSKGPNRIGVSPPLRMETDLVSETSCLFFFFLVTIKIRTMDKVQNPSNSVCHKLEACIFGEIVISNCLSWVIMYNSESVETLARHGNCQICNRHITGKLYSFKRCLTNLELHHEDVWASGRIYPSILHFGTSWRWYCGKPRKSSNSMVWSMPRWQLEPLEYEVWLLSTQSQWVVYVNFELLGFAINYITYWTFN
jgi:hypothetical protein